MGSREGIFASPEGAASLAATNLCWAEIPEARGTVLVLFQTPALALIKYMT